MNLFVATLMYQTVMAADGDKKDSKKSHSSEDSDGTLNTHSLLVSLTLHDRKTYQYLCLETIILHSNLTLL